MKHFRLSLVLLGVAAVAPAVVPALTMAQIAYARPANVAIHTPKPGSKERSAIMNALRVPVQKHHKGKRPTFTNVDQFRVGGGWSHLSCKVVDSRGRTMGEEGVLDFSALLKWEKGKWRVMDWAYHGDVVQIYWAEKFPSVPLNVLGLKASDVK